MVTEHDHPAVAKLSESNTSTEADTLAEPSRKARDQSTSSGKIRFWIVVITLLGSGAGVFLFILFVGSVSGREFSPHSFRERSFRFYEIPFLEWQITPIRRRVHTLPVARYLRRKSYVKVVPAKNRPWHLTQLSRGLRGSNAGDANLLVQPLRIQENGQPYWEQWSDDHPNKARVLWPIVQKLAQRELYVAIPKIFEIAQQAESPAELKTAIDQHIQRQYASLIRDAQAAGNESLAKTLSDEAGADFPDWEIDSAASRSP